MPIRATVLLITLLLLAAAPADAVTLTGTVDGISTNGGTSVWLRNATNGSFVAQTTADPTGAFSLSAPSATYRLMVRHSFVGGNMEVFNDIALMTDQSVSLTVPQRTVTVHVTTPTGEPLPYVTAEALVAASPPITLGTGLVQSACCGNYSGVGIRAADANGDISFPLLPSANDRTIAIYPPGDSGYATTYAIVPAYTSDTTATLATTTGVVLAATVTDTQGTPVSGSATLNDPSNNAFVAEVRVDGEFTLSALPGTYRLLLRREGSFEIYNDVSLTTSRSAALTLPLRTVTVHVETPTGTPISNVSVEPGASHTPPLDLGDGFTQSTWRNSFTTGASRTTDANGDVTYRMLPNVTAQTVQVHRFTGGAVYHSTATLSPSNGDEVVTATTAT